MSKPRNHVVVALLQRKGGSGAHVKSQKTKRQKNRQQLLKELKGVKQSMTSFLIYITKSCHGSSKTGYNWGLSK